MTATTVAVNAIDTALSASGAGRRLAFIPYLTAGYPDAASTLELGQAMAARGADVIELGVPFSDPLGDGPTIQRASAEALHGGMTVAGALELAGKLVTETGLPLALMGYFNPILHYGVEKFCADAATAGVSGLIVPDLPVEESDELLAPCRAHGMHLIYLLAPTSTDERIAAVAARASGFIYCMAVTGVTGARSELAGDLEAFLRRVRARTSVPLVVGFGISRPEHLRQLRALGDRAVDGAVVASALIDLIDRTPPGERAAVVGAYVERMRAACSDS